MQRSNIIAAAGSIAALLIGTVFVFLYTTMKVKMFTAGSGGALPGICMLLHHLTLPAFLVPAGFAAAFALMIKRQKFDPVGTVIFVTASCLFTLSWVLTCLLIWELPYLPLCDSL